MEAKTKRKIREGIVVSTKMQKTTVVEVSRLMPHPRYKKVITRSKKYYAHCEKEGVEVGKRVRIQETRPRSKLKRWVIVDVLS
ncbi:MAG: 30S ribosomal protein S17 [Chlamydiota bacterium]